MTRWRWILTQLTRRLWLRASLIGCIGIAAAVLAAVVERFIPWPLPTGIGADSVESILNIIASSMLAVTTFSLSVMTSAYGAATTNVTPRATTLLIEDRLTQTVLSTFIGSFLFGIVGIVVLKTGAYGDRGRFVLFVVTIAVIALIVISLLRWIDHLTRLGRVGETTERVEQAARQALEYRLAHPWLDGRPLTDPDAIRPDQHRPVMADTIGYVQHVDMSALSKCAEQLDTDIFVVATPGTLVYPDTPLAWVPKHDHTAQARQAEGDDSPDPAVAIRAAFTLGANRSFDQDPRFGLAVMSEIGSRALSPATNDPGTALDVINRNTRLLALWSDSPPLPSEDDITHPRLYVRPLNCTDLFEDAFMLIARDGAGLIEIQTRIQKALHALARMGHGEFRSAALHQAALAQERALTGLTQEADRARLQTVIEAVRMQGQ